MPKTKMETPPLEDTPAVIAYRMGQLENAVKDGFATHDKKLDSLTISFATKEELGVVQKRLDNWVWYGRAVIAALLTSMGMALASLLTKR